LASAILALFVAAVPAPSRAASKETIEMQAQIQQLLDSVQRLQSTMDKGFAVMQNLAQQTADNANQVSATVNALQKNLATQSDSSNGKQDAISGQVQSLNDSVDELKSRIAKLDKSIQDLQTQLQNQQAPPAAPPANNGTAPVPSPASAPAPAAGSASSAVAPTVSQTPPLQGTYQAAVRDYNAAKYELASGEFQDVIQYYPLDELAGSAEFYLGEIAYHQQKYQDAVKAYNSVLENFPGNQKAPAAQLRKGLALLKLDKKQSAITELRLLIKRHPQTPEAQQARAKLTAMDVKITASR
jgi:tol-pal system protein YbgF